MRGILFGIVVAIAVSSAVLAQGNHDGQPNAAWFAKQYNKNGQWCCDVSDGHEYDGDYVVNGDGSVTLDPDGTARTLPKAMILDGPNPTGHAVWWYVESGGSHTDYCFAPGAGG